MNRKEKDDIIFKALAWLPLAFICGPVGWGIWIGLFLFFLLKDEKNYQNTNRPFGLDTIEFNKRENLTEKELARMKVSPRTCKVAEGVYMYVEEDEIEKLEILKSLHEGTYRENELYKKYYGNE